MSTYTLIAAVWITEEKPPKVKAMLTWPLGSVETHTLDHDWSHDMWDWRGGRMPQSLTRLLRDHLGLRLHGERLAYNSPKDVGTGTNESGRVMIYEVDYEA